MNCQHCQNLLLDHLYGLLEGAEVAAVDAHLAACPACAAAHAETGRVQGLIARAAKSAFPSARFEPPAPVPQPARSAAHTPAPGTPTVALPVPAPLPQPAPAPDRGRGFARRIAAVVPWAVAAAVLLAVPGTVVPVLDIFDRAAATARDAERAKREAEAAEGVVETARAERAKARSDADLKYTVAKQLEVAILDQWTTALKERVQAENDRQLVVDVRKPVTVVPGAPNDFTVVVRDSRPNWQQTGGRLVAEVHAIDASDAVIFRQPLDHQRRGDTHPLRLPAAAWAQVKPDAELFLVVAQVDERTGARTELQEKIKLAGPVFTTLLVTDRPAYRPGDRLFFRSLTLDRTTFKPPAREQILKYELRRPDGGAVPGLNVTGTTDLVRVGDEGVVDPVRTADGQPVRGVGCGEFVLPADLPDGDYTLVLHETPHPGGFPATVPADVTRPVRVRAGLRDNYRKQIGFERRASYTSGETVDAWAEIRFRDQPAPGVAVTGVAVQIDGTPMAGAECSPETDAAGRARVRFTLPEEVRDGDVRLKVTFRTPHGDESVAERVPVIGTHLTVEFFPECGDAVVAGVPCKMYVRATTKAGRAVDIRGTVTDGRRVVARVESLNDRDQPGANRGLAAFTYAPELGVPVWLKLDAPAGVSAPILPGGPVSNAAVAVLGGAGASAARTGFLLPAPATEGVVMSVLDPITGPGEPFRVQLHSVGRPRTLVVGAYTRGKLSDTQTVAVEPDAPRVVKLMGGPDPRGGVVRITCFEEPEEQPGLPKPDLKPVAERLVFRKPGEVLNLTIAAARADAAPMPDPPVPVPAPIAPVPPGAPTPAPVGPLATAGPGMPGGSTAPVVPMVPGNLGAPGVTSVTGVPAVPPGGLGRRVSDPNPAIPAGSAVRLSIAATDEKGSPAAAILWAAALNSGAAPGAKDRLMPTHFLLAGEVKNPDDLEYADFLLTDQPKAAEALDLVLGTQGWRRFAEQGAAAGKPHPAPADRELTRLQVQNGQYTAAVPLRDPAVLNQKYAPLYERAVQAAIKAKADRDAAHESTPDADAIARAASSAETAERTAASLAARAEAARAPVHRFRANVWFAVAGLGVLALGCGAAAVARPRGRFPLGFSTLGAAGLAGFLVIAAGWDDRATAADPEARHETGPAPTLAKKQAAQAPAGTATTSADSVTAPHPDSGRKLMTGRTALDADAQRKVAPAPTQPETAVAKTAVAGIEGAPGGKGGGLNNPGFGLGGAGGPLVKVSPPSAPFPPQALSGNPPNLVPGTALPNGGVGAGGSFGPPAAAPSPVGPLTPMKPLPLPGGAPGVGAMRPGGGGTGWDPHFRDGVSLADLAKAAEPGPATPLRESANRADLAVEQAESLNRARDNATKFAKDRASALAAPMRRYFEDGSKSKDGAPAAEPAPAAANGSQFQRFAARQLSDTVNVVAPPLVVREYAAPRPAPAPLPGAEAPDTVLWQPVIVLPADGKATLAFHLGAAPGGYQVVVAGHTADGRLGAVRGFIPVVPAESPAPVAPPVPGAPVPPGPQPVP
jgi:hypothetical protein